ncbi:hypothetical protein EG240_02365 [Paenimyroides tangerinum]|uniref:Uncharacterized protein n=1 Tax=Paenimyroides tangerinum TaxID=2488728 RepID=A0A3P3WBU2_9FLAO|nr:hypothetical protein [Paenimyroides tangerinum]RRJ92652.1 hypothetical protein EG240_02365 [Paenimyroides tangerinum]
MKNKTLFIFSILFIGIGSIFIIKKTKTELNLDVGKTLLSSDVVEDSISYTNFLIDVKNKKTEFLKSDDAKKYLFDIYNEKISKYWIGTKWDFNGTTRNPNEGTIACGYFVTNVLADLGFKIQRVKLAQDVSSKMINELCVNVKRFGDFNKLKEYIEKQPNHSVFIIGLDFHTGYVLKANEKIYFLHSNYIDNEGVIKEEIDYSKALRSSKSFMIGNLSENNELISNWMK